MRLKTHTDILSCIFQCPFEIHGCPTGLLEYQWLEDTEGEEKGMWNTAEVLSMRWPGARMCLAGSVESSGGGLRTGEPMGAPQHHSTEVLELEAALMWRSSKSGNTIAAAAAAATLGRTRVQRWSGKMV